MSSFELTPPLPDPAREELLNTPLTIDGNTFTFREWFEGMCQPSSQIRLDDIDTEALARYVASYQEGRNPHARSDSTQ